MLWYLNVIYIQFINMPKIVLKDGSEFIVDKDVLDENILSAKSDEMIQLGKTFFKKS